MATTKKKKPPKCVKGQPCGLSCISWFNKDGTERKCSSPVSKEVVKEALADVPEVKVPEKGKDSENLSKEGYAERQKKIMDRLKPKTISSGLLEADDSIEYVKKPSEEKVQEKAISFKEDGKNLQPVIMRRKGEDGYEVVYGEDWVEAAKKSGERVFAHVFDMTDEQAKETRKEMEKLASQSKKTKVVDTGKSTDSVYGKTEVKEDITTPEGRKAAVMKRLKPRSDSSGLADVEQIKGTQNKPTAKGIKEKVALLEKHGKNLQPVILRRKGGDGYEVVYGEDWVEAAKKTKQKQVWSHVYDLDDEQAKEMRQKLKNLE